MECQPLKLSNRFNTGHRNVRPFKIIHFKCVQLIVCELYLIKAIIKLYLIKQKKKDKSKNKTQPDQRFWKLYPQMLYCISSSINVYWTNEWMMAITLPLIYSCIKDCSQTVILIWKCKYSWEAISQVLISVSETCCSNTQLGGYGRTWLRIGWDQKDELKFTSLVPHNVSWS